MTRHILQLAAAHYQDAKGIQLESSLSIKSFVCQLEQAERYSRLEVVDG